MPLGGSEKPQDALLKELVARQTAIDKRVERLESLEMAHLRDGLGCISWVDYDIGVDAVKTVNTPLACGTNHCYTTMTIWWNLAVAEEGAVLLRMQVDGLTGANYSFAYSFTQAGATTDVAQDNQTSWVIGYVDPNHYSIGRVDFPFWPLYDYPRAFGEWATFDTYQDIALSDVQRGNWGGYYKSGVRPHQFDIFCAGTPNLTGSVYLYGWCPEMTPGGAPDD